MVVTEHSGVRSTFPLTLAGAAAANYATFIQYDEFVHSLGALAPPGIVRFDLR
jgi:hypothetical protein